MASYNYQTSADIDKHFPGARDRGRDNFPLVNNHQHSNHFIQMSTNPLLVKYVLSVQQEN